MRRPRVAIPVPHSGDAAYAERALPQYERAIEMAGGEPVRIPLDKSPAEIRTLIADCDAVVLPGSKADVEPQAYGATAHANTAAPDKKREDADFCLLEHAYQARQPVLGICYGLQSLNVYRKGTLLQHIESAVNHAAGRKVAVAHPVEVEPGSRLAGILNREPAIAVNSSHHQSADRAGEGLRIVGRSPQDGVIEALEGTSPEHFVLAVQWHPERSIEEDEPSRAIFRALVEAARQRGRTA
jgi:putative glutamine amidotransferase